MGKYLFYLIYKGKGRSAELALRQPTLNSRDLIKVTGLRAARMYRTIIGVLDKYNLRYETWREGGVIIVGLPADIGYAVQLYMLLAYGSGKPEAYAEFLSDLLAGRVRFFKYYAVMLDLAIDLSEYLTLTSRRTTITEEAAKIVSFIMQQLHKKLHQVSTALLTASSNCKF